MGLRDLLKDPGWPSKPQAISAHIKSWLPQRGDSGPGRMTLFPLRQEEYVILAPFIPKHRVLKQLRESGRRGWLVVYDRAQQPGAEYLQRMLPIAGVIAPPALCINQPNYTPVGKFPNAHALQITVLHGTQGTGLALRYRKGSETTLALSHVIRPLSNERIDLTRRMLRLDHRADDLADHLKRLSRPAQQLRIIFHQRAIWDIDPETWSSRLSQGLTPATDGPQTPEAS